MLRASQGQDKGERDLKVIAPLGADLRTVTERLRVEVLDYLKTIIRNPKIKLKEIELSSKIRGNSG